MAKHYCKLKRNYDWLGWFSYTSNLRKLNNCQLLFRCNIKMNENVLSFPFDAGLAIGFEIKIGNLENKKWNYP